MLQIPSKCSIIAHYSGKTAHFGANLSLFGRISGIFSESLSILVAQSGAK